MGVLFAFLTAIFTAFFNVFIKKGMVKSKGQSNGFVITIAINVVVQGLIFLIVLITKGFVFHLSLLACLMFVLGGIFSTIIGRYAMLTSIDQINPSKASALKNTTPAFTVLLAITFLNEKLSLVSFLGFLVILSGIFMLGIMNLRRPNKMEKIHNNWKGYLFGLSAALVYGIGQVIRKKGLTISSVPFFGTWVGSLIPFLLIILYQGLNGNLKTLILENKRTLNLNFIIASVCLSFGPLFFFLGSSFMQVSYVSVIAGSEPFFTIILSVVLLKEVEKFNFTVFLSAIFILFGTLLIV